MYKWQYSNVRGYSLPLSTESIFVSLSYSCFKFGALMPFTTHWLPRRERSSRSKSNKKHSVNLFRNEITKKTILSCRKVDSSFPLIRLHQCHQFSIKFKKTIFKCPMHGANKRNENKTEVNWIFSCGTYWRHVTCSILSYNSIKITCWRCESRFRIGTNSQFTSTAAVWVDGLLFIYFNFCAANEQSRKTEYYLLIRNCVDRFPFFIEDFTMEKLAKSNTIRIVRFFFSLRTINKLNCSTVNRLTKYRRQTHVI